MSFLSKLGKIASIAGPIAATVLTGGAAAPTLFASLGSAAKSALPSIIGGVGSALGGASQASASNRGTTIEALIEQQKLRDAELAGNNTANANFNNANLDRSKLLTTQQQQMQDELIAREKAGRDSGNDAYKNIVRSDYALNKKDYVPPTVASGPGGGTVQLPNFGIGARALSAAAKTGVQGIQNEALARAANGNPIAAPGAMPDVAAPIAPTMNTTPFTIDPKQLQPGMMEKIGGLVGAGLQGVSTFDQLNQIRNKAATVTGKPAPVLSADDENFANGDA